MDDSVRRVHYEIARCAAATLANEMIEAIDAGVRRLLPTQNLSLTAKERAHRRVLVFFGVFLCDIASTVVFNAKSERRRGAFILFRSVWEYAETIRYYKSRVKDAAELYFAIEAKFYDEVSRMLMPSPEHAAAFAEMFLRWKATAGKRNSFSGNKDVLTMHLANVAPDQRRTDRYGTAYTIEYQNFYGTPSLYAHPSVALMQEVFPNRKDEHDWQVEVGREPMDGLMLLAMLHLKLLTTLEALETEEAALEAFRTRSAGVYKAMGEVSDGFTTVGAAGRKRGSK